ncbi:MAG: endonuclease/exonuclease/phosphatase family protein [Bacteroidaceae bacterium]|nr:endonuclease/exonuclease/phosphatase family protein [Bacteroidaceae bacterium]
MKGTLLVILWSAVLACMPNGAKAAAKASIGGRALSAHTIVYASDAEAEVGSDAAAYMQQALQGATGAWLAIADEGKVGRGSAIRLINDSTLAPFGYDIRLEGRTLAVRAGGCWAMQQAARLVAERLKGGGRIAAGFRLEGSVMGEHLFPLAEGANLRILDDNIWDYSAETIPDAWQKAGVDPRDDVRAPQFAQLVRAYMPDVVTLQEYSKHMHDRFYPLIQRHGYVISWESKADWNNTPIFYRPETLEQLYVNYNLYTPARWSNAGSKSFASAVFRHRATGKVFAVITTHLWYMNEKRQPGSTQARAAQVRLMLAEAEVIRAQYDCPVFVTGDMNCYESTIPMQQFFEVGFQPCYKLATIFADNSNGHHICSPGEGYSRKSRRPSRERTEGAIDHCLLLDGQKRIEVKTFDCVQAYFTIKLTDHYPNVIDAKL